MSKYKPEVGERPLCRGVYDDDWFYVTVIHYHGERVWVKADGVDVLLRVDLIEFKRGES